MTIATCLRSRWCAPRRKPVCASRFSEQPTSAQDGRKLLIRFRPASSRRGCEDFIEDTNALRVSLAGRYAPESAWVSVAPHSVRAVPLPYLLDVVRYARQDKLKVHMHVSEQPAEIEACESEYGARPFALLRQHQILDASFTAVHAIHITDAEIESLRESGAKVCACPTTERNLGDGIGPTERLTSRAVGICYGSDSNVQIDLLEDARQLEYHLRLKLLQRAVLAQDSGVDSLAARLFENATRVGAESVGAPAGALEPGQLADFFTVDLDDPSIAGAGEDALLSNIVFSAERTAIREVFVGGRQVVAEGRHPLQQEIVARFAEVQRKLWGARLMTSGRAVTSRLSRHPLCVGDEQSSSNRLCRQAASIRILGRCI